MKNKIIFSILLTVLFPFMGIMDVKAQEEDCNKTKVAVSVNVKDETYVYDKLKMILILALIVNGMVSQQKCLFKSFRDTNRILLSFL